MIKLHMVDPSTTKADGTAEPLVIKSMNKEI